ncbi:MAG TPA: hypothetical protein DER64_03435, partial [Planctomycetaceae bacterium]|nr:hypothetical protein [Planctomycetaceae bacterium]
AASTATKSGGKRLVMSSNDAVLLFIEDTLNLDAPDADAGPTKLAEFASQVASGAAKVIKENKARVGELMKDEKQLELSRRQLVGAVVRLRLLTRLRHRGSTIHIPRLSM